MTFSLYVDWFYVGIVAYIICAFVCSAVLQANRSWLQTDGEILTSSLFWPVVLTFWVFAGVSMLIYIVVHFLLIRLPGIFVRRKK